MEKCINKSSPPNKHWQGNGIKIHSGNSLSYFRIEAEFFTPNNDPYKGFYIISHLPN